jgi:hypothetical protein
MKKFDVYRCLACAKWKIVEKGNHHPWCGCGYDQFDWAEGHTDLTLEEAEKILEKEDK